MHNGELQAVVRLDGTGSVVEFDAYALRHNFGDTLMRQIEHYHRKISSTQASEHGGEGIANQHERVSFKHEILPEDLAVDLHDKTLFHDAWQAGESSAPQSVTYKVKSGADRASSIAFVGEVGNGSVGKQISLLHNKLEVKYCFDKVGAGIFSVEINLAMPSCDGPAGRFRIGNDIPGGFGQPLQLASMRKILLEDEVLGGSVAFSCELTAAFQSHPHFSVSQSEAGFEKIMQAVTLTLTWDMRRVRKFKHEFSIELEINQLNKQ